jgi:hypothetical protein
MTLRELTDVRGSLQKVVNTPYLPAATAYKVSKMLKRVTKEMAELEQSRIDLVKKLGADDGKGNTTVLPENQKQFEEEYGKLLDVPVEINIFKIPIQELERTQLSPLDFMNLEQFIEEPKE